MICRKVSEKEEELTGLKDAQGNDDISKLHILCPALGNHCNIGICKQYRFALPKPAIIKKIL